MLEFYRGVGQEAPLNFDARKKKPPQAGSAWAVFNFSNW